MGARSVPMVAPLVAAPDRPALESACRGWRIVSSDRRSQERVEHSILEMLSQRIYGLALGYEDINDHEQLRDRSGLRHPGRPGGAGAATSGQEHAEPDGQGWAQARRIATRRSLSGKNWIDELFFVKIFVESYQTAPDEIILDVDTTDLCHCTASRRGGSSMAITTLLLCLPLYIFCGEQILCARLRGSQPRRFVWQPCGNSENRNADSGRLGRK